jgi:2,4-dienoyl-CoA reductase-like NADH-dependent reductase (Old Yellow Enzyme family)
MNLRKDIYGGSWGNRSRIFHEICQGIETHDNFLLAIKINGSDCVDGVTEPDDVAKLLKMHSKIDLAEISCGLGNAAIQSRRISNASKFLKNIPENLEEKWKQMEKLRGSRYPLFEGYTYEFARKIKLANPDKIIASAGRSKTLSKMENI